MKFQVRRIKMNHELHTEMNMQQNFGTKTIKICKVNKFNEIPVCPDSLRVFSFLLKRDFPGMFPEVRINFTVHQF